MPATASAKPTDEETLRHFERELSRGGGGTVLYVPADVSRQFHLEPGTPVSVEVQVVDGQLQLSVRPHPRFSREDLLELGEEKGWELVEERDRASDEWALEFKSPGTGTKLRAESRVLLGDRLVNNVFIESPTLPVETDTDYEPIRAIATTNDLSVEIYDEEGLWSRLTTSGMLEPSDPPEIEEMAKFLEATHPVSVAFVHRGSSLALSLRDIQDWTQRIDESFQEAQG